MIKPTIGRIVWVYRPHESVDLKQAEPAVVCYVHEGDRYINVAGFSSNGVPFQLTSLFLVQEGEVKPEGNFACWMPYQQAAAKRA